MAADDNLIGFSKVTLLTTSIINIITKVSRGFSDHLITDKVTMLSGDTFIFV